MEKVGPRVFEMYVTWDTILNLSRCMAKEDVYKVGMPSMVALPNWTLVFAWFFTRFVVTMRLECMLKTLDTNLMLKREFIWEGRCDHFKRKKTFALTSPNFCISTLILKLKMIKLRDRQLLSM